MKIFKTRFPRTLLAASGAALVMAGTSAHALVVTPDDDPAALVNALLAPSSGITLIDGSQTVVLGATDQQGTYSGFNLSSSVAGNPTLNLPDGVVLTSGTANFSTTTNTSGSFATSSGTGDYTPLVNLASTGGLNTNHNDSNVLTFDFTVDDPGHNAVIAQFIFATEEFPTQSVTDIMAIFVNGVNYAFFPNGDLVSNQSGDPNDFFNDGYPIEWNGLTDVFTVTGLVNPGVNTLTLAIADTSDTIYDSVMFFGGLHAGFTTGDGGIGDPDPTPTPSIPEPASLPLLMTALIGLAMIRRRARGA